MIKSVLIFVCLTASSVKGAYGSQNINFEKASALAASLETTIELTIELRNLLGFAFSPRFICDTYTRPENGQTWRRIHTTEFLSGTSNPVFSAKVRLPYLLKDKQELLFNIFDSYYEKGEDYFIFKGLATCKTADLLSAGGRLKLTLKSKSGGGKAINFGKSYAVLYAEVLTNPYDKVVMKLRSENMVDKKICGGPKHYLEIYKRVELEEEEDAKNGDGYIMAKRDEYLKREWDKISIPFNTLCDNDRERKLKFVCLKGNNRIGEFKTTVQEIETYKSAFEVTNEKKKLVGEISIYEISINHLPTFADFIAAGLQLHLTIAVDFSRRKTLIENPKSFHYQGAGESKCEKAIRMVLTAFEDFVGNDQYEIRGFGAEKDVGKMFPLIDFKLHKNADGLDETESLEDTLQAYRDAVHDPRIRMVGEADVGSTLFGVIDKTKSYVPGTKQYFVLVVLTAGEIKTDDSRLSSVIEYTLTLRYLPLSIIFVGIGDGNFSNVSQLFEKKSTSLYQQTSFIRVQESELESDADLNAYHRTEMLAVLPNQVVSYMYSSGQKPESRAKVIEHMYKIMYLPLYIIFVGIGDVNYSHLSELFERKSTTFYQQSSFIRIHESELGADVIQTRMLITWDGNVGGITRPSRFVHELAWTETRKPGRIITCS